MRVLGLGFGVGLAAVCAGQMPQSGDIPPEGLPGRRFVDADGTAWIEQQGGKDAYWAAQEDDPETWMHFWRIDPEQLFPFPESVLMHPDGRAEIRYKPVPVLRYDTALMDRSLPVYSLDREGNERRGVWVMTTEDRPSIGWTPVPFVFGFESRAFADGGPIWRIETMEASVTHPPKGAGIDLLLPGSETVPFYSTHAYDLPFGSSRREPTRRGPSSVIDIIPDPDVANQVPPTALPAMMRVQNRLNRLLINEGNRDDNTFVEARLRFAPVDQDTRPDPGEKSNDDNVLPRLFRKAETRLVRAPRFLNLARNQLEIANGGVDDAALDPGEVYLYGNLRTESSYWARVGPGGFPGTLTQLGDGAEEVFLTNGLIALAGNSVTRVPIRFNAGTAWDFNPKDGISAGQCDFEATLMHEMVHALGFNSNAGHDPNRPFDNEGDFDEMFIMDLFRFDGSEITTRPRLDAALAGTTSTRPRAVLNSAMPFFPLSISTSDWIPMSSGAEAFPQGDNREVSHWQDVAYGGVNHGIMNPTASPPGVPSPFSPFYLSLRDVQALDVLGWHIDVPVTSAGLPALLAQAAPGPGIEPIDIADASLTPTLRWSAPSDGSPVDVYVFLTTARGGGVPVFEALALSGTSITVPSGVLRPSTTYTWTTVSDNGITPNQSGPYAFTTAAACLADVNGDGFVLPNDFAAWIAAFNAGAPGCDQNGDGQCLSNDFASFIANYNAGC
jgi:hypothetical protein